jgi:Ca-activated chloride channel family protein
MRRASFVLPLIGALALCASVSLADTGVIIPSDKQSPDPAELSIESLHIRVTIDNGHATVHWDEVFCNQTSRVLEGTYVLTLPGDAAISDFAVWDDLTRIPGVILERKRAGELYNQIRNDAIDPGLLQSGEVSESNAPGDARHSTQFSVKIVPIPAYGYKRIEAEYRETLPVNQLQSEFVLPLKSTSTPSVASADLTISIDVQSPHVIAFFKALKSSYPLDHLSHTPMEVRGTFHGTNVPLADDFAVRYSLANDPIPGVRAYRSGAASEPGYFEASALLQRPVNTGGSKASPRTVLVLFDTSLSMQWDKLERSFQSLDAVLRALTPQDSFNVLVFNSEVAAFSPSPVPATVAAIAKALDFVRASRLSGGTDLQVAFKSAFAQARPDSYVVLLSDGELTSGIVSPPLYLNWFDKTWQALPHERRPHIYALAIGDDANLRFMRHLADHAGVFEQVGSTEPLEFKLNAFVSKIGLTPIGSVRLDVSSAVKPALVYRLGASDFPGSIASWVGQYGLPGNAALTVSASGNGSASRETRSIHLPQNDTQHPYLPAAWARARVDALLDKIDRDGEDKASIEEIIALSRKYRFVTPYTSFLAAPRALLRPRLIRPGDPVLRVRTDSSVLSVIALFPFGPTKSLRHLKEEGMWQTRFLAPADLPDGTQTVRLILRDREGHVYREQKSFVISSHAPLVRVWLDNARVHPGAQVKLHVQASSTTRTVTANLYGAVPLFLRWNESEKANTGILSVPSNLPAGRYTLHVTAEDIAHNISRQEVPLEVLP